MKDDSFFSEDIDIDKFALDDEWLRQPSLVVKWSRMLAEAQEEYQQVKDELEMYKAKMDSQIRADPTSFGLSKVTEGAVSNCIMKQKRYAMFMEELREARLNVNILTGARAAVDHKKKALEKLTELFLAGYYSEKLPKNISDKLDDEVDRQMRRALKEKKKRNKKNGK